LPLKITEINDSEGENHESANNSQTTEKTGKAEYSLRVRYEDSESDSESDSDFEIGEDDLRLLKNARIRLERPIKTSTRLSKDYITPKASTNPTTWLNRLMAALEIQMPKKRPKKRILSKVRLCFRSSLTDPDHSADLRRVFLTMDSICLYHFHSKRLKQEAHFQASKVHCRSRKSSRKHRISTILGRCTGILAVKLLGTLI
jgi:hypothetical protein